MDGLTFLKKLYIQSYPMLVESCKSEDWLAHTQNLKGDLASSRRRCIEFHYAKQSCFSSSSLIV